MISEEAFNSQVPIVVGGGVTELLCATTTRGNSPKTVESWNSGPKHRWKANDTQPPTRISSKCGLDGHA